MANTIGDRLSWFLNGDDTLKGDDELAREAQYLADQRWKMGQLALQEGDAFKSDEYLRGEAMALGEAMVGKVGGEDAYGIMWSPDQRGYKTGREFKDAMVKLWKEPESFVSKDWEEFSKLDRKGRLAKAMENVSATKQAMHAVGNFLDDHIVVGGAFGAMPSVESLHTDEEKAARQTAWEDRIIRDYEAKLRKKNAWMDLMAISSRMDGGAKTCLDALLQSGDNALPERLYTTFNSLSDRDKEIVCHARELMKPTWDGTDAGTIAHDAAVGLLNIAAKLAKSPVEQATKLTAIGANGWFDTGIDVNAIARRRQYLWNVTGGLSEKDSQFMEFEQRCEDHGIVGDALIGAVSTLPYMAAAAVPYAGPALVAAEAMQEMDERIIAEGGDITNPRYLVTSAVLGGIYAYIERLQVGKLIGEVGDLEIRGAMVKGLWQAWRDKPGLMAWNLTEKTLSESVQEGLQNGVMGVNEALGLGKSVPAAFGEGFVEDFVGSLGTMFVIGAGGHVVGHAVQSGWKGGAAGQKMRADNYLDAVRDGVRTAGVFERGEASATKRMAEITEAIDRLYGAWKENGRGALDRLGLSEATVAQIEDYYRESESLADGMTPSADEKFRIATTIAEDISEKIKAENAALRTDPGRVGRAEKWLGRGNGLADMRRTWARGNALTQYKVDEKGNIVTDENGKPVIEADLGAKELEKDGYTPEVAKAISELLRQEHREFYSKGAVDAMRHAYEKATDRQTAAAERLAAGLKGGEVVRRDGLTFVRFDVETEKDADGKPIVGKAAYVINEDTSLADRKPDFAKPRRNEATSIANDLAGRLTPVKDEEGNFRPITADLWMVMTPAEREEFWNRNGSGMRGNFEKRGSFTLVNPETGSEISAESIRDIGYFIGRINIDPRTDETAIYHENLHGLVRFCREMGILNDGDIAEFVKTFGSAKTGDELFDEEPFAKAAEAFVVKRRAGSAIEDTPANRALAKLFSFGMLIAAEDDIRWAEQKAAERSMKAVTDQMEVTAANRKADESGKSGGKVVQPETAENKGENGKGGLENKGEQETRPVTEEKKPEPKPVPQTEAKSDRWEAAVPKSPYRVKGHYLVLKLGDIVSSDDPAYAVHRDWQNRIGENKLAEASLQQIKDSFYWKAYGDSAFTDTGAPIVLIAEDAEGKLRPFVVSGNGRIMVLKSLLKDHMYDKYRDGLKEMAAAMGLEVPEDGEEHVLVRVIDDLGGISIDEFVTKSNGDNKRKVGDAARAKQDAATIVANALAPLYKANADGTPDMTPGVNDEFFRLFSQRATDGDAIYDENFNVVEEGRNRVMRALLYVSCGQGDRGPETVDKVIQMTDTLGIRRQRNAMECCAAAVAALEANPDYAIGPDVSRAMADYMEFVEKKRAGKVGTFADYLGEQDMFDPRSEIADGVLRLLEGSKNAREIADTVRRYCDIATKSDRDGGLQGADAARTREDVWREAMKLGGERYSFGNKALSAMEEIASGKSSGKIENARHGTISYPLGTFGTITESGNIRHGLGLLHIVYARMAKEGSNLQDAIDVAIGVAESAAEGEEARSTGNRLWLDKNGIRAVIAKNADGQKVITGYEIDADRSGITSRAKPDLPHLPTPRSEDVIAALKNRIAQIRGNGNRLADAVKELSGNIGSERMKRLEARYSFAAANPVTLTGEDVKLAISKWGTTDDINKGIYCLPDGTMLQGKGQAYVIGGRKIEAFGHDGWVDLILKNAPKVDTSTLEGVAEAGGQIEAAQRGIAALGAIRIVGDKNGFTVSKEPTAAQYDALYDMAEKAYQVMESNGDDEMLIDVTDENLRTIFTLRYARGTSPRRIIDDLRGWYERGENPDERERSLLAEFHRWSFAPNGVQKGAAVEYPDAGAELRAMDDAAMDARWSIADLRQMIYNKRPDIPAEDVEAYIGEIRGYESAKKRKLAVHWIITGAIELPEDAYKLDKAIATAERAKVDPFQYRNPEDIFAAFQQHLPKEKPIDPDTIPELTAKEDRGHGITVYTVSEEMGYTDAVMENVRKWPDNAEKIKRSAREVGFYRPSGQIAMRKIINTHWGKDASPWCLLQGDGNTGELSKESLHYWKHYSALPKKVAFLNGRLLAFMATDKGSEELRVENEEFIGETLNSSLLTHNSPKEQWWDRKDASHAGIPIEGKIAGDPLGRSGLQELKDGKLELVGRTWKGDRKNGKYEEWNLVGNKVLEEEFKNGRPFGWRRAYSDHVPGKLKSVEHFNEKGEHDRPQVTFNEDKGITYIEYTDGDRPLRSLRVGGNGDIVTYQMNGGEGSLAKIAIHTPSDGTNISWTDDAGNYYGVFQDQSGNIDSAYEIRKGEYGRRSVDLGDAALRAKLEGESAAVFEVVKAEAAAIYREYGANEGVAQDGSRYSFGMGRFYRNRAETQRHIDELSMKARKAEAYGADLVKWLPTLKDWGFSPITRHDLFSAANAAGEIRQGGGSVPRTESAIDERTGEMGDWVRGFMRRAKSDLMLSEMESDEFDLKDGVIVPRRGAPRGEIGRTIRRDISPVPFEAARKLAGFDAYFALTARNGQEARGLAACFKETAGFYDEIRKLKNDIEAERRLGKDKGIAGRPTRLDQMGVNVANEGRVIGATPIEDWVGGEANYSRMRGEILQGVTTARLWEIVDGLKSLPRVRMDEPGRTYLDRAGRLILATHGRVADPALREQAKKVALELAKEIVTDDLIARVKADIAANKATSVQPVVITRFGDRSWIARAVAVGIVERLKADGFSVNPDYWFRTPAQGLSVDSYGYVGHPLIVDDLFSDEVGDIPVTVEGQKRFFDSQSATVVFGFGTKTGSRFAIPSAELTQLLKDAKISPAKFKEVFGYEIQKATGPEIRRLLRRVHAGWQDLQVLVGSRLNSGRGQLDADGVHGGSDVLLLDGIPGLRGDPREVLHGLRGIQERGQAQLESRLNDDSRWSIASRKIDWDALPDSLDRVIFNTSVQHFTGQDKLPELYDEFKVYRDHGLLEIVRPQVEAWANGAGAHKWLGKYLLGKYYGDLDAAKEVVRHRVSPNRLDAIRGILLPNEPVYWVYVRNDDGRRTNRLPEAYAGLLAERYGGKVESGIVKVSDERNTSADMKTRAQREFQFRGEPKKGAQFVIVDDVWTTGSTAASLTEYLVGNGVDVRGVSTLAIASHGADIKPTEGALAQAMRKAGIEKPEDGLDLAGVDIRRATGSELQAYLTGAKPGRTGFVEWFDPSANSLNLDFGNKGESGGTLPMLEGTRQPVRQGMFDFGEDARSVEAAARWSYGARLADGDEQAAERALVNYVAYHKLTGGAIPRAATLAKLGLTLGMKSVQAKRIIEDAQRVADRAAGTVIEKAARNGDVGTAFSLMEREKEREEGLRKIISGGAKAGGDLVLGGVVAQGTLLGKRIEQTMRTMTAADLADMEGDTGIDLAAEILENDPKAFDEELKAVKPKRGEEAEGEGEGEGEGDGGAIGDDGLTDRDKWKRDQAKKEAAKRVQEFIERAKQKADENKQKAAQRREENRQRAIAGENPVEPGMGDTVGGEKFGAPEKSVAGFRNKWEFAAFVREWAWDKYQKTHGTTSLGKSEENRLFAEFYRKCAAKMLQDLADKLLDPKGARAWANRRIGELEKGLRPDTIERASADIFAFINRNAIREERGKLIEKFRKEIQQFITGKEFEELKEDSTRRLTGWVEEAARYMMKVCQLSAWATNGHASAFEKERNELLSKIEERREVYDGSGRDEAYMEANDAEIVRARWKLALLEQYGGMAQMMPGEIESLKTDAIRYLTEEAVALEERWKDTKEKQDRLRRAIAGGIVGPNGQRYESKAGWFGHLFDDLNGLLRLRLKHLMRFAGKKERADGEAAINEIVNMLGRGEVTYARAVQRDRRELFAALGRIFQDKEGRPNRRAIREYLKRMEEDIPSELSRQLSNQGFAEHMTYGQMLQLLVSLEQKSYAENVRVCGRGGQAELIRNSAAFTQADALFIDWLRAFYEAKRGEISEVTLRMVGNKVDSPDPLYCPVKIYRGELAKDLHIDAGRWNAIDDVLSRRVMHLRDFDESASILGQFYDRSNRMAGLIAWAESGTVIQNVICSGAVQQQINLAFGSGESAKIRRQLEDTFNGGTSRSKTPGEIVFMDKAMNFITFGYLGFNPLSAAKQTTSFTVWANVLPGGFRELWHHMTHIDREAVRHIMESDEYKVRYGDDTGSGQDFATKALNENVGQNPFMRLMTGPGMWLLKKGDFLPGIWIMQGVYKSLLNKHFNEGMDEAAADRLAITEAFNLLEETQQSGRTYNTSALAREHGRLGSALVQFATSPLQQLQYETQAFREWRDLKRYGADPERIAEARAKLVRAAFINHVLLPAAMELVISVFRAIMGDEPKWEKDGYAWDLLRDVLLGQASRIFYVGVLASSMIDALFKRQMPRGSQLIPSEGAITVLANVAITAHDVVTLDGDKVQKDLERMAKSLAPTRIPYNLYRRVTGDSDVDRKKAKAK